MKSGGARVEQRVYQNLSIEIPEKRWARWWLFFKKKIVIDLFERPAKNDSAYKVRLFYLHFYFRQVPRTTSARRQGGLRSCATRARRVRAQIRVRRPPRADGDLGAQEGSGSNVMSSRDRECQTWEEKGRKGEGE